MIYPARFLLVIYLCLCYLWPGASAQAQTQTSGNVVYTNINPPPPGAAYNWSGFVITGSGGGEVWGGDVPGYNPYLGQFMFGWNPATIGYTIALQTALQGTGIGIRGIEYGLQYWNQDYSRGSLNTTVSIRNKQGATLESYYHELPQTTEGWTNFDRTRTFTNPYLLSNVSTATMTFSGQDDRFWAGWWGPQFRNPYMRFNYTVDMCAANPLSTPDCPGYAAALLNQQCSISALYNPACPGYTQARHDQQCSIDPLSYTDCPGYTAAYRAQQCEISPLYDQSCPGYSAAYAKKNILNTTATTTVATTDTAPAAKTDPVSIATTSTTTSATSPTSVTSVTSVISGGTTSATNTVTTTSSSSQSTTTTTSSTTTQDAKKSDAEVRSATTGSSGGSAKSRAEARAKEVARAASEARTLEAQAATQGLVVGLMGFVPGFDSYGAAKIADVNALEMQRKYSRPNVDNRSVLRQLSGASDSRHREMVDQQYDR